jgi:hypothetical protein
MGDSAERGIVVHSLSERVEDAPGAFIGDKRAGGDLDGGQGKVAVAEARFAILRR